mmetsp:Transcript_7610/g.10796  ORF Transcript_7610/g.10796 Transcript_7610/m.10796 type:complete len:205 (-) Transcript_7610:3156-3770(-)
MLGPNRPSLSSDPAVLSFSSNQALNKGSSPWRNLCFLSSLAVGLSFGTSCNVWLTKSQKSCEKTSGSNVGALLVIVLTRLQYSVGTGNELVAQNIILRPKLHMSALKVYWSFWMRSGLWIHLVPRARLVMPCCWSKVLESPKSDILVTPLTVMRIFSGLKSRWMICKLWRCASPFRTCDAIVCIYSSGIAPNLLTRVLKLPRFM